MEVISVEIVSHDNLFIYLILCELIETNASS